jgi:branched-chain amino acid transport system substrate-binding protein
MPQKRTVSLAVGLIMLVVGAAAGIGGTYLTLAFSGAINGNICNSGKTITIGELLDLSSTLSDQGKKAQDSSTIAITDLNAAMVASNCNVKFQTQISDYGLVNSQALSDLQAFAASGISVVVGPLNSGAAQYVLSYAHDHNIVLISPSSTSPTLAISGDYLFRTAPNDAAQGAADGRMLWDRGAKSVIIIERHDSYGDGLANATAAKFKSLGGTVIDTIAYDTGLTTFSAQVDQINTDYTANNATKGPIAIDAVSFQEFGTIIQQMNSAHPALLNIRMPWFGVDGEAQNAIIANSSSTVGALTAKVKLPSTLYASANNSRTVTFLNTFATQYPSVTCDTYCLGAYDDVWLGALATLQAGTTDGAKIQAAMLSTANNMYGVTGWMGLQPSGDRVPTSYQIWKVIPAGTGGSWTLAGSWDQASDTITWTSPP